MEFADWRWIFLINLPLAALTVFIAVRTYPRPATRRLRRTSTSPAPPWPPRPWRGTYALIEQGGAAAWLAAVVGVARGGRIRGRRGQDGGSDAGARLFRDRTFSASNVMTLLVYGALGAQGFFVTIQLQTVERVRRARGRRGVRADDPG